MRPAYRGGWKSSRLALVGPGLAAAIGALAVFFAGPPSVEAVTCGARYVSPSGDDGSIPTPNDCTTPGSPCKTVQHAIDAACAGDTVNVRPGTYSETAAVPSPPACAGDTVGLYIADSKAGLTIQGVTAGDVPITSAAAVLATINTNSSLCFGPDGIFVQGDGVTIAGVRIGTNASGQNKTIEIWGDDFTLKNSDVDDPQGSVYLNDANFDTGTNTSHLQSYRFDGNVFEDGVSLDITSGAGFSGPVAGRVITGNTFLNLAVTPGSQPWPSVSFNGSNTGVPWFVYSVGGATITGNTFSNTAPDGLMIRARGTYDNTQFDWATYFTGNTFNRSVVVGPTPPANLTTHSLPNAYGTFNDIREIGASIQGELTYAQPSDTVLVGSGSYDESPDVTQSVTLKSSMGRSLTTINLQTGPTYLGSLHVAGATVTVDGFTIVGRDGTPTTIATSNIYVDLGLTSVTIKNNRLRVGAVDPATDNGDDGFGVLTTFSLSSLVANLAVTDNVIEPLNASAERAFFINDGVNNFTLARNQVTGKFNSTARTQAKNGLVQDNTVDGLGLGGRGLGTWGYPDATVWGHTTFQNNVFSGLARGVDVLSSNSTVLSCNQFVGNGTGVEVSDNDGGLTTGFDPTTVSMHGNSFVGDTVHGAENSSMVAGTVPATSNWWGCAAGPGNAGCDTVNGALAITPVAPSVPTCVSAGAINLTQAKFKRDNNPAHHNGSIQLKGDFVTCTTCIPPDVFTAATGISLQTHDELTSSQAFSWPTANCTTASSGKTISCKSTDKNSQAIFKQLGLPNQWKFQIKLKRLTLPGPFQGPVSATISYGAGIDRQDQIMDCHATTSGLSCREF